jgi:hypothetical protein
MSPTAKKRKSTDAAAADAASHSPKKKTKTSHHPSTTTNSGISTKNSSSDHEFQMLTLEDIQVKIEELCSRVPPIPENSFMLIQSDNDDSIITNNRKNSVVDESSTREWAAQFQAVLEEFNLYVCCVATATYKWGTERSGASDQNLGLLTGEMAASQEQISSTVSPRLSNVLAPVVDLVVDKTVVTKDEVTGVETKQNHYTQKIVDPNFSSLAHTILARNAPMMRQVVLSNFHKLLQALKDYLNAQKNDIQHSRGLAY